MKNKTKKLGQHFLKNNKILKLLANSLGDIHNKIVVEIGGGHGELSKYLIKAKKLIIYEIDKNLATLLKLKFPQAVILNENFLKADLSIFRNNYFLIGNIPYSITGKIIRKIFSKKEHPKIAVLTLQKEYGEKILGKDGNNFLHSWVNIWNKVKKLFIIKRKDFFPTPKVDSIALKFEFYNKPLVDDCKDYEYFLKRIFKYPNKNLKNNLEKFNLLNIDKEILKKKPHQLSFQQIFQLYLNLKKQIPYPINKFL